MEVKDPVHGTIEFTPPEVAVVDSQAFQRLRNIKQLGFGEYSFPGATHSRFLHSLGVAHLAGEAFDSIFKGFAFRTKEVRWRLRQTLRLAALLHDIGHGPLSHSSEEVMPELTQLKVALLRGEKSRRANHEDYTLKFVTDSPLSEILRIQFPDISPVHIACLIETSLKCPDDFFREGDLDLRPILAQIVSSELDVDRMDYLSRDSYFCGTNYGKVETSWLISNLTLHCPEAAEGKVYLALNRRALYTFDDFLISRHHMYLMVYFHHKSIIYDEMLVRFLTSPDCDYSIPADINDYLKFTDFHLYEHMGQSRNPWAQRVAQRRPLRMLFELHTTEDNPRPLLMRESLENAGIRTIHSSSATRLSKYHPTHEPSATRKIFVVDQYDKRAKPYMLEKATEIFHKYEEIRRIERLYVPAEDYMRAEKLI